MGIVRDQKEAELRELKARQKENQVVEKKDVIWRPGVQDTANSEGYETVRVLNEEEDEFLTRRIGVLESELAGYLPGDDMQKEIEEEAKRDYAGRKKDAKELKSIAWSKYEQELEEYKSKNFFARIFSNKKPLKFGKNATAAEKDAAVLEKYGESAIDEFLVEHNAIKNVESNKRIEIRNAKEMYGNDPKKLQSALDEIDARYSGILGDLKDDYRGVINHEIEKAGNGRGGRR